MNKFVTVFFFMFAVVSPVRAGSADMIIDDFEGGLAPGWAVRSFVGFTDYRVVMDGPDHVMLAESNGTASSLYFKREIDLEKYPVLSWQWKVEATIPGGNARVREGDDYPARIYVVFPSWLGIRTRAINYIWANTLPQGRIVPSPFTANSQMVAVESGNDRAGEWISERRNVFEDFRMIFGEDPPPAGGIAIMTDSDNTGTSARAWYDDIRFEKAVKGKN